MQSPCRWTSEFGCHLVFVVHDEIEFVTKPVRSVDAQALVMIVDLSNDTGVLTQPGDTTVLLPFHGALPTAQEILAFHSVQIDQQAGTQAYGD